MSDASPLQHALALISLGLEPERRGEIAPEALAALRAYREEPEIQRLAQEVARGLGLRILDVSIHGVVLSPVSGSAFAQAHTEYIKRLSAEERLVHGLIHVALAAYLFPRAVDLDSEDDLLTPPFTVRRLDEFIREACTLLAGQHTHEPDSPAEQPELQRAFRVYLALPPVKTTQDGRRAQGATQTTIAQVCERLSEGRLLVRRGDAEGGTFQALRRYRIHVREVAAHEALQVLRADRGG